MQRVRDTASKRCSLRPAEYSYIVYFAILSFFQNEISDIDNEQRNQVVYRVNQLYIDGRTIFWMLSMQIHFHTYMDRHRTDQKNIEKNNYFLSLHLYHTSISQLLGFILIGTVNTTSLFTTVAAFTARAAARVVTGTNTPLLT